jgi:dTDP-4-amino-4,6-dideoxygalactose transaminase
VKGASRVPRPPASTTALVRTADRRGFVNSFDINSGSAFESPKFALPLRSIVLRVTSGWVVPLVDIDVDATLAATAREAFESGWWTMGTRVAQFEDAFATYLGAQHAIAVSSGTAALHLALLAVGTGPDDEVVLPSLNFVAAANMVRHTGATPVFCDIQGPEDLNLDPGDLAGAITPRTRAIVALHYVGFPCAVDEVVAVAEHHGVALIEDAAHAPGARWRGKACGTIGAVGCFSFFSNKNLPVGEGGMVVTDDSALADQVRLLRSHGMTALTWERHEGHASTYEVVLPGFNYRLDEVRAAIGVVQLERLDAENAARRQIASRYRERLDGLKDLIWPMQERDGLVSAHHLAVVLVRDGETRESVRRSLRERGIQTSVHYPPIHRFSAYRELGARHSLPRTEAVAERILTLPLYGRMSHSQVDAVVEGLRRELA